MSTWVSARISADHEVAEFDCGNEVLNVWLRDAALRMDVQGAARVRVWTHPDDQRVMAYYAIAPTEVRRDDLSRGVHGGNTVIPGYLLGRLALDRGLHGQGLGTTLLLDATELVTAASQTGGGRLLVVDAIDETAASFYEAHGFTAIEGTNRLYVRIASLRRILEA